MGKTTHCILPITKNSSGIYWWQGWCRYHLLQQAIVLGQTIPSRHYERQHQSAQWHSHAQQSKPQKENFQGLVLLSSSNINSTDTLRQAERKVHMGELSHLSRLGVPWQCEFVRKCMVRFFSSLPPSPLPPKLFPILSPFPPIKVLIFPFCTNAKRRLSLTFSFRTRGTR